MHTTQRTTRILVTLGVTLGLACTAGQAIATHPAAPAPVMSGMHDGRYYEVVIANKISWDKAKAAAEAAEHDGIQGHLATMGSPEEDQFVEQLRAQAQSDGELWVGGYQVACVTTNPEPGCGWLWVNGEAISAVNTDSPYTNWLLGEPNNRIRTPSSRTLASEDHLAIGHKNAFGWNDEGSLSNIRGYVIEYGDKVTVPASTCTADGPGCNPTGAQVLQYPPSAQVAEGATLTARTFFIKDKPQRCGVEPLTLFDGAVVIPRYLCGHPDFLVIETESSGVSVPSGAIDVENLTEEVLPNNLYGCTADEGDPDPSHRDVVAWQSSDALDMLETTQGAGRFVGTVAEVTYGCGSSRGKVRQGSYHFVGLRIHPGADNEYASDPQGNHQSFVELTRYKLGLLQSSVVASKATLPKFQYLVLKALVDGAVYFHDHRKYKAAQLNIRLFVHAAGHAKYTPTEDSFSADHIMRGANLEFMYKAKLIPFIPPFIQ